MQRARLAERLAEQDAGGPVSVWLPGLAPRWRFEADLPAWQRVRTDLGNLGAVYAAAPFTPPADWLRALRVGWVVRPSMGIARAGDVRSAASSEGGPHVRPSEAEERLRAAIAEFAAGAGHEINNPLGAIVGQARMLLADERDEGRAQALGKIVEQAGRIQRMIRDLRHLGVPTEPQPRAVAVDALLTRAIAAAQAEGAGAIALRDGPSCPPCWADPVQAERLFAELMKNAAKAAGRDGWVRVSVAEHAGEVEVRIADSGPGFTPADRQHLATPFYSGRPAGRGLGMGLPVALTIARQLGGAVHIADTLPTCVTVTLPSARQQRVRSAA